jgi:WD40 repeat protein
VNSVVRQQFQDNDMLSWLKRGPNVEADWSATLQILEGHSGSVYSVAFSHDGKQLASGSDDKTVRIWDAATGAVLQKLEVDAVVTALSFSVDGSYLATDRGRVYLAALHGGEEPPSPSSPSADSIFVQDEWILHGSHRMLWLPLSYRPSCSAVYENVVCIGNASGSVSVFEFSFQS